MTINFAAGTTHREGGRPAANQPPIPDLDGALCPEVDTEIFFPNKGGSTRAAKLVCRRCPVRTACLQWALDHGERFGIWGGLSERERRARRGAA